MVPVSQAVSAEAFEDADSDYRPAPISAERLRRQVEYETPGIDSRTIRGMVVAVILSLPLWAVILLAAFWIFG